MLGEFHVATGKMHGQGFPHDSVIAYDKFKSHAKTLDTFYTEFVVPDNNRIYAQYAIFVKKNQSQVAMEGPLLREERTGIVSLQWNEHFYGIEDKSLYQFENPQDIDLNKSTAKQLVLRLAGCSLIESSIPGQGQYAFIIKNGSTEVRLAAPRKDIQERWMFAIKLSQ
jgi:hypothetical protein